MPKTNYTIYQEVADNLSGQKLDKVKGAAPICPVSATQKTVFLITTAATTHTGSTSLDIKNPADAKTPMSAECSVRIFQYPPPPETQNNSVTSSGSTNQPNVLFNQDRKVGQFQLENDASTRDTLVAHQPQTFSKESPSPYSTSNSTPVYELVQDPAPPLPPRPGSFFNDSNSSTGVPPPAPPLNSLLLDGPIARKNLVQSHIVPQPLSNIANEGTAQSNKNQAEASQTNGSGVRNLLDDICKFDSSRLKVYQNTDELNLY